MIKNKSKSEIKKYIKNIFIPIVIETAQKLGFDKKSAQILAKNTKEGSLIYLNKSKLSLSELINKVASKGGTTEAGLCVLSQNRGLDEAILKAYERAKELGMIWKE
jgi:pyrroline-5-carboxylate reductase